MAYELPKLDYDYAAIEHHSDEQTMEIHHSKHHQDYVTNLNKALEGHPDLASKDIQSLISDLNAVPENIRTAVRNNGGGHFNHSLFWKVIGPGKGGEPSGALAEAINNKWGSFVKFKESFETAGATRFGRDRKSTRLNSSHVAISYAVFC